MYFSAEEKKQIEGCRFCFMCRHICPVGNVTGREANNPRARALTLSMISRGTELTPDMAESMYECALCGGCTNSCAVGFDPPAFVRNARLMSQDSGQAPAKINSLIEQIDRTGSPYAKKTRSFPGLPAKADVVLFFGCNTDETTAENAVKLLQKAGVSFTVMNDEPCCGIYKADWMGQAEEARQTILAAAERINQTGAKTLVSVCPSCTRAFVREYKAWGAALDAKVVTLTSFLAELIQSGKLQPTKSARTVTYHDPCRLARDLDETEAARTIITACANLKEMFRHGKDTVCCGGGTLALYRPDIVEKTTAARWKDAASTGAATLVTACPTCSELMGKTKPDMALTSIEQLLLDSLT